MEMFRVAGMSSEHLMGNSTGQRKDAKRFLGVMFRLGAPPKVETEEEAAVLPEEGDVEVSDRHTEKSLNALKVDMVREIAASLGVADLEQTKAKLVEAILEKQ